MKLNFQETNYKTQVKQPVRHPLNFEHYEYVINNCRDVDLQEITLMGYTRTKFIKNFDNLDDGVTGTYHGIPFLASGTHIMGNECWYWFIGTPLCNDFFFRISGEAERLIKKSMSKHPNKKHLVQVWSKHKQSVKWLNMLKFKQIDHYMQGNEKIYIVERKRN
jgi:hypothetical protein